MHKNVTNKGVVMPYSRFDLIDSNVDNFVQRVRMQMTVAATAVSGEPQGAQGISEYDKRQNLALNVLQHPNAYGTAFANYVAANGVFSDDQNPEDSEMASACLAAFSKIAGVRDGD